jgi:hypothetical protein
MAQTAVAQKLVASGIPSANRLRGAEGMVYFSTAAKRCRPRHTPRFRLP